jgi:hypothetical protein
VFKNHIAAAASMTPEGKRMSLNVEHVGNLMVQHYVEEISERAHGRLVSSSDSIGPDISSRTSLSSGTSPPSLSTPRRPSSLIPWKYARSRNISRF